MSEWISVQNELPKKLTRVIVIDNGGFGVITGMLSDRGWYLEGIFDPYAKITHWMPLPEPPKQPE